MAWWEFLDSPDLYTTGGVFLWAAVVSIFILVAGLGLAFAWHKYKGARKRKRGTA